MHDSLLSQTKIDISISYPTYLAFDRNSFDPPRDPFLLQLNYKFIWADKSRWQQFWGKPHFLIQGTFIDTDEKILGAGFGCSPGLEWQTKLGKTGINLMARVTTGIVFMTEKYDFITNPTNNAIGSSFNNISGFSAGLGYSRLSDISFYTAYQLTHISNGRTSTPNTGLNFYGWNFGLIKKLKSSPKYKNNEAENVKLIDEKRHITVDIGSGLGFNQHSFRGGPNYKSYYAYVGIGYRFNPFLRSILCLEYEFNESIYQFYNQDFVPRSEAIDYATLTGVSLSQVLRFGYIGVRLQGGYYLPYPEVENRTSHPNWLRLSLEVYFRKNQFLTQPYIGVGFKTHKAVAQYVMIYGGTHI